MPKNFTTAKAHPNIAFIKYWGNADQNLRLPANASISMNLSELETVTKIAFLPDQSSHLLKINGILQDTEHTSRVATYLESVRNLYEFQSSLAIESHNNFPMGAGIASSASAFAALAVALNDLLELNLPQSGISALARLGSGSACRSIPAGFTVWEKGRTHLDSFAATFAPPDHWELRDIILIVAAEEKAVGSTQGHALADTSPYQSVRVHDAKRRLEICRRAILNKDFNKLAWIIEQDSDMMHAVMMTSRPPINYWQPASIAIMQKVRDLRKNGIACAYTLDAGPNVHVITLATDQTKVINAFKGFPGLQDMYISNIGAGAQVIP